jgi:hypothetical protein
MKRFKNFLENYDVYLDMPSKKTEEEEARSTNSAYLNLNSQLNPYNQNWTTDMYLANVINPRNSMELEKTYNTDVGIAFDQDADTGELYGSPEGFKAVAKRDRENKNIKLSPPPTMDEIKRRIFNVFDRG